MWQNYKHRLMKTRDLLILLQIKGIGPAFIMKNRTRLSQMPDYTSLIPEFKPEETKFLSLYESKADRWIDYCRKEDVEIIDVFSPTYPHNLLKISDAPAVLFLRGNKSLLSKPIAIIGTRHSTSLGNRIAERLGEYFSKEYSICNGLVEGIDEHSVYVNGKMLPNVVGIISGGIDYKETCSKAHCKTIDDVLEAGGLIVSEFMPDKKEDSFSGSKASRIQAALSLGIILVQSSVDGGSKYTIKSFAKLHRPLGVICYPEAQEFQTDSFGANRLILEQREKGVAQFIGLKASTGIDISAIIPIKSSVDYSTFKSRCTLSANPINTLF